MKPGCGKGTRHDHVLAEPVDALRLGELVDGRRREARVDGPAHQDHCRRQIRIASSSDISDTAASTGTDGWQTAIALRARAEMAEHVDDVVDVVVEIEGAFRRRHHAGVRPVGDVDVVLRKHRRHRAAEQRRVVAGERRHDEERRIGRPVFRQVAFEMQERAERPRPDDVLGNRDGRPVHHEFRQCRIPACRSGGSCARRVQPLPPSSGRRASRQGGSAGSGMPAARRPPWLAREPSRRGSSRTACRMTSPSASVCGVAAYR